MSDLIKNRVIFFREFLQEFDATGSFCATSKRAARALIEPLNRDRTRKRILEAGPGTGSVTFEILEVMRDDDELVICEINPRFMSASKENLELKPLFHRHHNRISFFEGAVQDLPQSFGEFDLIICAIPFLNLDLSIVKEIFSKFLQLSHPDTILTYYEYIGMRKLGKAISPERRKRFQELESFFEDFRARADSSRKRVWLNLLPINVYRIEGMTHEIAA